jgi:starch phosphorylase
MVEEYTDRCYMEASLNSRILGFEGYKNAKDLVSWLNNLRRNWKDVLIRNIEHTEGDEVEVHSEVVVKATVKLGSLTPNDVCAQVYYGKIDDGGNLFDVQKVMMDYSGEAGKGEHLFQARIPCEDTGRFGYTVRVLPSHANLIYPVDTGLITWAS